VAIERATHAFDSNGCAM